LRQRQLGREWTDEQVIFGPLGAPDTTASLTIIEAISPLVSRLQADLARGLNAIIREMVRMRQEHEEVVNEEPASLIPGFSVPMTWGELWRACGEDLDVFNETLQSEGVPPKPAGWTLDSY
jgi:hypothetical protein